MKYEELRSQYKEHLAIVAKMGRLKTRAQSGGLSPERLAACKEEIARLSAIASHNQEFFTHLEKTKDPIWRKMSGELNTALEEYKNNKHDQMSIFQMVKKLIGVVAILILGTQLIDSWRRH
jgi:hypothetical protein